MIFKLIKLFCCHIIFLSLIFFQQQTSSIKVDSTDLTYDTINNKHSIGMNLSLAANIGLLSGATFTNIPTGATVDLTTLPGFKIGPFGYAVSIGADSYF